MALDGAASVPARPSQVRPSAPARHCTGQDSAAGAGCHGPAVGLRAPGEGGCGLLWPATPTEALPFQVGRVALWCGGRGMGWGLGSGCDSPCQIPDLPDQPCPSAQELALRLLSGVSPRYVVGTGEEGLLLCQASSSWETPGLDYWASPSGHSTGPTLVTCTGNCLPSQEAPARSCGRQVPLLSRLGGVERTQKALHEVSCPAGWGPSQGWPLAPLAVHSEAKA